MAAQEGEQRVREALQVLIERGQRIRFEALRECLIDPVVEPWEVAVEKMDVGLYDTFWEPGGEVMSTGNLPRLRECLIELHLPAFREHYAAQAALATQESLIHGFSCRYLRSRWRSGRSAKSSASAESRSFPGRKR